MSKPVKESPAVAQETSAASPDGVSNTKVSDLLRLDVSRHVEKKPTGNGVTLSYLSWAWAWDQALRIDPEASFTVSTWTDDLGRPQCWMDVNGTAMVWVSVRMLGMTRTCNLPVMNARNEPISIEGRTFKDKYGKEKTEKLDAFNVNTAIMRCLTKCLALFGLGLYIYAGEDLPSDEGEMKPAKEERKEEKKEEQKKESSSRADAELFAEMAIKYVTLCGTVDGLKSYWKANQTQLDSLKEKHSDLFEQIRSVFVETRVALESKQ